MWQQAWRSGVKLDRNLLGVFGVGLLAVQVALEQAWIKNDWCPLRRESFLLGDHVLRLERIHFEIGQNLVHDSRINLLAPRSISSKQGVETQVVNVPWNAFAVPRDSFQSSGE